LQLIGLVIIEPFANGKTRQQWSGEQTDAGGGANEGEARQVQPDAAGVRPLIDDDVQFEILHRRVKVFLDGFLQAMNFIDEKDVPFVEVGEQAGEVSGFFDGRAAGAF